MSDGIEWIDKKPIGPFNGVFVVLNLGEETKVPPSYIEKIKEASSEYMASGFLTIRAYEKGIEPIPWYLEDHEEHSIARLSSFLGVNEFDFPLDPDKRISLFEDISKLVFGRLEELEIILAKKSTFVIAGACKIGGQEVFMPPVKI